MAIIEFFAFEARKKNQTALKNYMKPCPLWTAKNSSTTALNYLPEDKWHYFKDRVSILKDSATASASSTDLQAKLQA